MPASGACPIPEARPETPVAALLELERLMLSVPCGHPQTAAQAQARQEDIRQRLRTWAFYWVGDFQQLARVDSDYAGSMTEVARTALLREVGENAAKECAGVFTTKDPTPPGWKRVPDSIMRVTLLALRSKQR